MKHFDIVGEERKVAGQRPRAKTRQRRIHKLRGDGTSGRAQGPPRPALL